MCEEEWEMNDKMKMKQNWKPLLSLIREARLPWAWIILNTVLSFFSSTVYTMLPYVQGSIMAGEIEDMGTIGMYVLVTIAYPLISAPLSLLSAWNAARITRNLRQTAWQRIVHQPMLHLDTVPPTSLISRITTDCEQTSSSIDYVMRMFNYVYTFVITLATIGSMNRTIMLMMAVLIPCIIIANIPSHYMHRAQYELSLARSRYTNFLAERMGALKQIKASGAEEKEDAINDAAAKDFFRANIKQALLTFLAQPLTFAMDAVVQAVILIYGGYLLSKGTVSTADMIALYSYGTTLSSYSYEFVLFWQNVKKGQGAAHTVANFIHCPLEQMERPKSFAIPDADLRLEDVSFAYEDGERVLDHVSMEIPTGKVTAIVGPSGSGKTTVLKLLERLYQPTGGKLMFGGIPAEEIHLGEWRESFGMVPQASPLLFGTIRDNITYGIEEEVSEGKLSAAMDAANVTEIIRRLPEGIETDVGDVGSKLSGGEKQRIAIARMMIRDPEYLLLDEATSSLDAENEYQITQALNKLMAGRTTVIVAHNLRTIEHADNIIFMERGQVRCCGTHKDLYEKDPTYRRYVDLQRAQ